MSSRAGNELFKTYEYAAIRATHYYWLGRYARIGIILSSTLTIASSILILWITLSPLYVFQGVMVSGIISITHYKLYIGGIPAKIPVLDSLTTLSYKLFLGSILSSSLVSPSLITVSIKPKIPRIYIESAAAGYGIAGLTVSLLISFLRVLYMDILPIIPIRSKIPTHYGEFTYYSSIGKYTEVGLLSIKLYPLLPVIAGALIGSAVAITYYLIQYYEEILELPPIPNIT